MLYLASSISLLVAICEVAAAFREGPFSTWHAVRHRWAVPFYAFYIILTILLGLVLVEHEVLGANWTSALILGLAGPAVFKTQSHLYRLFQPVSVLKLFQPVSGSKGLTASLERVTTGIQQFCFAEINRSLAQERLKTKETLARIDQARLLERLQAVYSAEELSKIDHLIEERRNTDPSSVNAFIVALIERKNPDALDSIEEE